MPPTVASLDAEVTDDCGLVLQDAGLFLRALDSDSVAVTPAVRRGLRDGAIAVGMTLADPELLQDSDVANLSGHAIIRVKLEAELYALQRVLAGWYRVTQDEQEPLSAAPMAGGWRMEQRADVRARVAELKEACREPYREPSDAIVVMQPDLPNGPDRYGYFEGYGYGYGYGGWPC